MPDMMLRVEVVPYDGSNGRIFWRNGERYLREDGVDHRLLDIAPTCEEMALQTLNQMEQIARAQSLVKDWMKL